MPAQDRNNPLHGVGIDAMFSEILRHYHWEILAEQLKFKCLENHPNFSATTKFLKKTTWAREKAEAFYLYKFKQLPIPSDEEQLLPPRERTFDDDLEPKEPAVIKEGDKQFYDDPISGPKFHDKQFSDKPSRTRAPSAPKPRKKDPIQNEHEPDVDDKSEAAVISKSEGGSPDPWGKWK